MMEMMMILTQMRRMQSASILMMMILVISGFITQCSGGIGDRFQYVVLDDDPDREPPKPQFASKNYTLGNTIPEESRLVSYLLRRYSKFGTIARPIMNSSDIITVHFGMRLIKMSLSEKDQTLRTSVWVRCQWTDEYLRWEPSDFGGVSITVLPFSEVWKPDIVLVNTADTDVFIRNADIMVDYRGMVFWAPHRVYTCACLLDVTNYPYDTHICDLWFQAMSRYSMQMDLQPYPVSPWDLQTYLTSYKESQEWGIIDNTTARFSASRQASVILKFSRRVSLRFSLTITRESGYTGLLLMVPCVFLGCTTLVIFWLPPDRPDRITLAMSLLASFLVLLLILVESAPPTAASIPTLGIYYACVMVLIMLSPFLSSLVVHISRRGSDTRKRPPIWCRKILLDILAWPLCLHGRLLEIHALMAKRKETQADSFEKVIRYRIHTDNGCDDDSDDSDDLDLYEGPPPPPMAPSTDNTRVQDNSPSGAEQSHDSRPNSAERNNNRLERRLSNIEKSFKRMLDDSAPTRYKRIDDAVYQEWKLMSQVIDRICFCLYLIVIIMSHLYFYPRPR